MKTLSQLTVILAIMLIATTSCTKRDDSLLTTNAPVMTDIKISGEGLVYNITIFFNEGVYANKNKTGDLSASSFCLSLDYGDVTINSYIVTHSSCQKNAKIRVVLNKEPGRNEIMTVQPTSGFSIYNFDGVAMCISEKLSIAIADS